MTRFPAISSALGIPAPIFSWNDVLSELEWLTTHKPTEEDEALLLRVSEWQEPLALDGAQPPPGRARLVAAEILVKWTGMKYRTAARFVRNAPDSAMGEQMRRAEGTTS